MKRINLNAAMKEIKELKALQAQSTFIPNVIAWINDDGSIGANLLSGNGKAYKSLQFNMISDLYKYPGITEQTNFVLDDMNVSCDLYLPTDPIIEGGSPEQIREFMRLANSGDEIGYMAAYIELFKAFIELPELNPNHKIYSHSLYHNGRWLSDEELKAQRIEQDENERALIMSVWRQQLKDSPALLDLLDHFDKLSLPELVERYKDQRFFTPASTP